MLLLTYIFREICSEVVVRARTHSLAPIQRYSFRAVLPSPLPSKCTKKLSTVLFSFLTLFLLRAILFHFSQNMIFCVHFIIFTPLSVINDLLLSYSLLSPSTFIFIFPSILALKDSCTMSKLQSCVTVPLGTIFLLELLNWKMVF